jgi:hypothetical protein
MKTVEIFVEGIADEKFIGDYLTHLNAGKLPSTIKITSMGGVDKLKLSINSFIANDKEDVQNVLILDADGDVKKRKEEIEVVIKSIEVELKQKSNTIYFLFPNDTLIGDLESLLQEIINPNNKEIFDCWQSYEECLSSKENAYLPNKKYTTPANKTKIYAYLEALLGSSKKEKEKIKEKERNYLEKNHWDLNHSFLAPLQSFLSKLL